MFPVVEKYRACIPGGTWTPKATGTFQEGDPKKTEYLIRGGVEIRERGGQLKLFCTGIKLEKRKKRKPPPPPEPDPDAEGGEEKKEDQQPHKETNEEHVRKLLEKIEEVTEKNMSAEATVSKAPQFLLYLSPKKPKSRMPNIHKEGVRLHVKRSPDGAFAANDHSTGDFEVVLKDIPDILHFSGLVVLKLPQQEPKTEEPQIIGMVKFEAARHTKINSISGLGLNVLADVMTKATGGLDPSAKTKKKTSTREKLQNLNVYRRNANAAWASMDLEQDEELNFNEFKTLLEEQDIHMLAPQAKRAFLAVEVQGDGQLGLSEYENFLMLYDIMVSKIYVYDINVF